jgi:hypothetical protein
LKKSEAKVSPLTSGGDLEGATRLLGRITFVFSLNLMTLWEGEGRGFCAMLLRLIIKGIRVRETPPSPPRGGNRTGPRLARFVPNICIDIANKTFSKQVQLNKLIGRLIQSPQTNGSPKTNRHDKKLY